VANGRQAKDFYEFGPYRLNPSVLVLSQDGVTVRLTPKVLLTLKALLEKAGDVVTKEELLRSVWPDTYVEESNLAQNISVLRRALGTAPKGAPYIETVVKRGYRFSGEVHWLVAAPPPSATALEAIPIAPTPSSLRRLGPVVAALLMLAAAGIMYQRRHALNAAVIRSIAVIGSRSAASLISCRARWAHPDRGQQPPRAQEGSSRQ
jgi:DNA-binding winged helix-turn-helix (wHTH) protein